MTAATTRTMIPRDAPPSHRVEPHRRRLLYGSCTSLRAPQTKSVR